MTYVIDGYEGRLNKLRQRQERVLQSIDEVELNLPRALRLQARQKGILDAIGKIGASLGVDFQVVDKDTTEGAQGKITRELARRGMRTGFRFVRVLPGYYDKSLAIRRMILKTESEDQLCKSIVLRNTAFSVAKEECGGIWDCQYVLVLVQYTARLNPEKVKSVMHRSGTLGLGRKKFNWQLADEEVSCKLTGYGHNAVCPVAMPSRIPIILSDRIAKLPQQFFFMGGGETDLKLGVDVKAFLEAYEGECKVADITVEPKLP